MVNWVRSRKLGRGSFATVNLAIPRNDDAPLMAVKTCVDDLRGAATLANEKSILDELKDCPEIIRCYGDCFTYENNERLYNLLLEFAPNGTLHDKLRACSGRRMSEREVMRHTKAILKGLRHIHESGYVHCDIKLQNILLFSNGGLKIADFGLARKSDSTGSSRELRGTPLYMSPEMLASGDMGPASDVWALGCIVGEMLAGAPMWRCSNLAELVVKIGRCDWSTTTEQYPIEDIIGKNILSDVAKDFITKCLVRDPSDRWTAEMLLSHPFVCGEFDNDGDEEEERSKENCVSAVSTSPRCVFDFPEDDHVSSATCSITSLPSSSDGLSSSDLAVERVKALVDCAKSADWSVSDDWVSVR